MKSKILILACWLLACGSAQATLIDRGSGLIYDSDLNVTWLSDANYSKTIGAATSEWGMTWSGAMAWAANLTYFDSIRNVTYDDWRLPTSTVCGNKCPDSELGHLFYVELGGVEFNQISETHNANYSLFSNIESAYWSGTSIASNRVYGWNLQNGHQYIAYIDSGETSHVWVVRDGDVAATIPEPSTLALFGLALGGFVTARYKRVASN